jgi:FkbM family methyltransferase
MFEAYRRYPFNVPRRTKFINFFRYFFKFPFLERTIVTILENPGRVWWKKVVPPLYLYPPGSVRKVKRDGIHYALDVCRLLDHSIYFHLINDTAWSNLFKFIKKDFHIIDAGANIGFLSMNFARNCPDGFVYSFEPDSETFAQLSTNLNCNSFSNIKIFKQALGEFPEQKTLYKIYINNPGANRILSSTPGSHYGSESVDVTTLDIFDANEKPAKVDLIKIDVEGFELFVLKGGKSLIAKWRPLLFIELVDENLQQQNCSALGLLEYVEAMGYAIQDAKTLRPVDKSDRNHTDILCFPL